MSFMGFLVGLVLALIIFWSYAILLFWPRIIGSFGTGLALSVSLVVANFIALMATGHEFHLVLAIFSGGILIVSTRLIEGTGGECATSRESDEIMADSIFSEQAVETDAMYGYTRTDRDD